MRYFFKSIFCCFSFLLLFSACQTTTVEKDYSSVDRLAPASQPVETLRYELKQVFDSPSFYNAHWGVLIQSLDTSQVLYSRNAAKGFMPASNMKIYSTAAALALLGEDFMYETLLYSTDSNIDDGVINGDLYVLGSGDPSFAARFHDGNTLAPFERWAEALKQMGIKRVTGNLIGDDDIHDDTRFAESWYYSYLDRWYAAQPGGLCLNDNCYDIFISPGEEVSDSVQFQTNPPQVFGDFIVSATTGPEGSGNRLHFSRKIDTNLYTVSGSIGIDRRRVEENVSVHNPTLFFTTLLKYVLEEKGIPVGGNPKDIDDVDKTKYHVENMKPLADYHSPTMCRIIKAVNKPSQNLYADQVMRTVGQQFGQGGTYDAGYEVIKNFLESNGIDSDGFYMDDGSGLGRINLVQPRQTVGLLETMARREDFSCFYDSLPIAGVDGTIRNRMKGTRAEGNVHAKTGYINRVRSLSGYVTTLDGETLIFCMMANNYTVPTSVANRLQDTVCNRLANFTRHPE